MFLTRPRAIYKDSYLAALRELQAEGLSLKYDISTLEKDFDSFVKELREKENLVKQQAVPETILWLIDKSEYIGRISIRHKLNERLLSSEGNIGYEIRPSKRESGYGRAILTLGLKEAKELGMSEVLITCDSENTASKRIIEANGGVFENEVWVEKEKVYVLRYWIYLQVDVIF